MGEQQQHVGRCAVLVEPVVTRAYIYDSFSNCLEIFGNQFYTHRIAANDKYSAVSHAGPGYIYIYDYIYMFLVYIFLFLAPWLLVLGSLVLDSWFLLAIILDFWSLDLGPWFGGYIIYIYIKIMQSKDITT